MFTLESCVGILDRRCSEFQENTIMDQSLKRYQTILQWDLKNQNKLQNVFDILYIKWMKTLMSSLVFKQYTYLLKFLTLSLLGYLKTRIRSKSSKSHVWCPNMTNDTSLESSCALLLESAKKLQICKNWISSYIVKMFAKKIFPKWYIIHFWKAFDHAISNMQKFAIFSQNLCNPFPYVLGFPNS